MYDIGIRIKAARQAHNLIQADLASRLGMRPGQLSKIEHNRTNPSMRTLSRVAAALDMSVLELLGQEIQNVKATPEPPQAGIVQRGDLCALRKGEGLAGLPSKAVARICTNERELSELEAACGVPTGTVLQLAYPYVKDERGAEVVARAMRTSLDAGSATFADLAGLLEFRNVRLHRLSLPKDVHSRAFFHLGERRLSIVLNARDTPERQTYRLAYELGAATLFATSGYRTLDTIPAAHRFASSFAVAFLMPEESVRATVAQTGLKPDAWNIEALCALKTRFNVSAEALALRLEELRLILPSLRLRLRDSLRAHYAAHPDLMEPAPRLPPLHIGMRTELLKIGCEQKKRGQP